MHWFFTALASLVPAAAGLVCGGFIGQQCVRWHRISSFEGGSGYFVIGAALAGAAAGFLTGAGCGLVMNRDAAAGYGITAGTALLVVLTLALVITILCRLMADVPPRLNGKELMIEIEIKLPAGMVPPAAEGSSLLLHAVAGRTARGSQEGRWQHALIRVEEGRWIVPGAVELFTQRGRRMISVQLGGDELTGYQVPLPARPGRDFLRWSEWGPRPRPPRPAWPETKASYRFRIQPRAQPSNG